MESSLFFARYESLPALIVCKYYYCYYYSYSVSIRWLSIYFRNSQCVFLVMNSNGSFRLLVKTFLSVCLIVSLKMSKKIFQVFASLPENVMENIFLQLFRIFSSFKHILCYFFIFVFWSSQFKFTRRGSLVLLISNYQLLNVFRSLKHKLFNLII